MLDGGHAHAQTRRRSLCWRALGRAVPALRFRAVSARDQFRLRVAAFFLAKQGAQQPARDLGRAGEAARDNVRERRAQAVDRRVPVSRTGEPGTATLDDCLTLFGETKGDEWDRVPLGGDGANVEQVDALRDIDQDRRALPSLQVDCEGWPRSLMTARTAIPGRLLYAFG